MLVIIDKNTKIYMPIESAQVMWVKDSDYNPKDIVQMVREGQGIDITPENIQHLLPHAVRKAEGIK